MPARKQKTLRKRLQVEATNYALLAAVELQSAMEAEASDDSDADEDSLLEEETARLHLMLSAAQNQQIALLGQRQPYRERPGSDILNLLHRSGRPNHRLVRQAYRYAGAVQSL